MTAQNAAAREPILTVAGLSKAFTLHMHSGRTLNVMKDVALAVHAGECVVLGGPSGAGKSSILRMLYGNYLVRDGRISVSHRGQIIDLAASDARTTLEVRRETMGYVSQFLRVIPRVPALDIVAEAGRASGLAPEQVLARARELLTTLNLPDRLWSLPPATFSGGEQQRVNIARGFAGTHPILILDEPTASLDALNRDAVVKLILNRKAQGTAFVGIFHDEDVRTRVADRIIDVTTFAPGEAA